jgi:hypothetical protein
MKKEKDKKRKWKRTKKLEKKNKKKEKKKKNTRKKGRTPNFRLRIPKPPWSEVTGIDVTGSGPDLKL